MASNLTNFYSHVVQNVIHNVRADFEAEGLDESVLDELQSLWETKLKNANVLPPDYKRPTPAPTPAAPDLNLDPSYEGEGYVERAVYEGEGMTPTADILFSPVPFTPKTSTPGLGQTPQISTPQISTPFFSPPEDQGGFNQFDPKRLQDDGTGRSSMLMPSPYISRETPFIDMNVAYVENRDDMYGYPSQGLPETKDYMGVSAVNKRKRDYQSSFPQEDGAADEIGPSGLEPNAERRLADEEVADMVRARASSMIPQMDGIDDNYDNHVTEEDYNLPGEEDLVDPHDEEVKPTKAEGGESEDSEPPLNEDDDDDDLDDFGEGEESSKTDDLVLAQFEKVTKVKGKWKCVLKDGVMHLGNRDFLFSKANGEFDFF